MNRFSHAFNSLVLPTLKTILFFHLHISPEIFFFGLLLFTPVVLSLWKKNHQQANPKNLLAFCAFRSPSCPPRCELALGPASCVNWLVAPLILPLISCGAGVEGDDISMSTLLKIRQHALWGATSGVLTSHWFLQRLSRNENRISVKDTLSIQHALSLQLQKSNKKHTHTTFVLKAFSIQYPQCSALNVTEALWLPSYHERDQLIIFARKLWFVIVSCWLFSSVFFFSVPPFFFENIVQSLCYLDENVIIG